MGRLDVCQGQGNSMLTWALFLPPLSQLFTAVPSSAPLEPPTEPLSSGSKLLTQLVSVPASAGYSANHTGFLDGQIGVKALKFRLTRL